MPRITSFSLDAELDAFVQEQIASGAYSSASEVVRAALSRMAEETRKEAAVLAALDQAMASKSVRRGVPDRVRGRVRAMMRGKNE